MPDELRKWEQQAKTSKEDRRQYRGLTSHPRCGNNWRQSRLIFPKWQSATHKEWRLVPSGLRDHVATDGFVTEVSDRRGACGLSLLQLDYDGELGPTRGINGTLEVKSEVQHTIKRAELTAVLCLLESMCGPPTVQVDNTHTIDWLWKEEKMHWPDSERCGHVDLGRKFTGCTEKGFRLQ